MYVKQHCRAALCWQRLRKPCVGRKHLRYDAANGHGRGAVSVCRHACHTVSVSCSVGGAVLCCAAQFVELASHVDGWLGGAHVGVRGGSCAIQGMRRTASTHIRRGRQPCPAELFLGGRSGVLGACMCTCAGASCPARVAQCRHAPTSAVRVLGSL